jgi:hypothetical protein
MACLIMTAGSLCAQSSVLSGEIAGRVADNAGQSIRGARITLTDPSHGVTRTAVTDDAGVFRILAVPPGAYELRAEAAKFRPQTVAALPAVVGETTRLDITLESAALAAFSVEATARTPIVALEQTQQADVLDQERIDNLPINRRNYLDFALMTPATVSSNDLVDDGDYRAPQSPQSGLSINGNDGRGNTFSLDGVNNDYNSGGVRPSISQAAVAEFQVNRNSYTAEFGGATGGVVNIVSKSGSNRLHGDLFGFLRDRALQARNFFEGPAPKSPYTRTQDGAALGGPLVKNRTFFFAAFERLDRHETIFVPILQDPSIFSSMTASQQALATYFGQSGAANLQQTAGLMQQLLITNNFPATLKLFNDNSGDFPFAEADTQFSIRLDHRFSARHTIFVRANLTSDTADNTQFGALIAYNRSRSSHQFDGSIMLDSTFVVSPNWLIETRGGFGYNNYEFTPNDANGPQIDIYGYGYFGRDYLLPSKNIERNYQFQQTATHFAGKHVWKFGYDFVPVQDSVDQQLLMGGQFGFGAVLPLGSLLDLATGVPNLDQALAAQLTSLGQAPLAANLGDTVTALQSYNLGIPTFYQQGFGDPDWTGWAKRFYAFAQDSYKLLPNLKLDIGLRYELEVRNKYIDTNKKDFAPRFGFAWSPGGAQNTVVRGGFGMYYGTTPAFLYYIADQLGQQKISTVLVPIGGFPGINPMTQAPLSAIDIYQTLSAEGVLGNRQITAADLGQFGLFPSPTMPFRLEFGVDPHFANPYAEQASFEIQHAFGDITVSAAYNFNRGLHGPRAIDRNVIRTGTQPDGQPIFGQLNPLVLQDNIYDASANNYYNALVLHASRRWKRSYLFDASYTFSKDIDDVTDFAPDYEPDNETDARAERALSPFYRKHSLVGTAVADLPLRAPAHSDWVHQLLGNFKASGILQASSFRPFNVITGYDSAGDNHTDTHRPYPLGRDAGIGPDFCSLDLRLSREIPVGERLRLQFTGDLFNTLNRTNFRTVNNVVGSIPLSMLPQPLTGHKGNPTDPLAFTSAYDPRQLQAGLWVRF